MNYVPIVVEQSSRGERSYDIYSRLLKDRIVFVTGPIDDNMANVVIASVISLSLADPDNKDHPSVRLTAPRRQRKRRHGYL